MALSNIGRQPRKEIGESLVGLAVFATAFTIDWLFTSWACFGYKPEKQDDAPYFILFAIMMLFLPVVVALMVMLLFFTHWLGEQTVGWVRAHRGVR